MSGVDLWTVFHAAMFGAFVVIVVVNRAERRRDLLSWLLLVWFGFAVIGDVIVEVSA